MIIIIIILIIMSCPWLENRESKDFEKTTNYSFIHLFAINQKYNNSI